MATAEAAIKVRGVSHQFGEAGETRFVRALADTSLDVTRGELMCLIGPSGLRQEHAAQRHRRPDGAFAWRGRGARQDGCADRCPSDIAFVFQENALFPWNTIIENIELGMTFQGVPKSERAARAGTCA